MRNRCPVSSHGPRWVRGQASRIGLIFVVGAVTTMMVSGVGAQTGPKGAGPPEKTVWLPLAGEAIGETLSGARVVIDGTDAVQAFEPKGRVVYDAGRRSEGRWRAEPTRICTTWPPDPDWICYGVEIAPGGERLRLVAPDGSVVAGRLIR